MKSLVIAGFVRGLSVRDVEGSLAQALGPEAALSKSTVSRVCEQIKDEFQAWTTRSLADVAETRRRTKVIGRLPGERACLSLVWAVLDRAGRGWRGVPQSPAAVRLLQDLRRQLLNPSVIQEVVTEAVIPAA